MNVLYRSTYGEMLVLLLTFAVASQEDVDGGEKLCGFAHALLGPLAFGMKPSIIIGQKPVVLFFGQNLRQPDSKFSGFDQVVPE